MGVYLSPRLFKYQNKVMPLRLPRVGDWFGDFAHSVDRDWWSVPFGSLTISGGEAILDAGGDNIQALARLEYPELTLADVEVRTKVWVEKTYDVCQGGAVVFRVEDNNDFYQVEYRHDNDTFHIQDCSGGSWTEIASATVDHIDLGEPFELKGRARGDYLEAWLVHPDGTVDHISCTDTAHAKGDVGIRNWECLTHHIDFLVWKT